MASGTEEVVDSAKNKLVMVGGKLVIVNKKLIVGPCDESSSGKSWRVYIYYGVEEIYMGGRAIECGDVIKITSDNPVDPYREATGYICASTFNPDDRGCSIMVFGSSEDGEGRNSVSAWLSIDFDNGTYSFADTIPTFAYVGTTYTCTPQIRDLVTVRMVYE